MKNFLKLFIVAAIFGGVLAGCQQAAETADTAGDAAKSAGEAAGDAAKTAGENVTETATDMGEKAGEAANNAGDAMKEGAEKTGEAVKEGADKALRVYVSPGGCSGFSYGMQLDDERADGQLRREWNRRERHRLHDAHRLGRDPRWSRFDCVEREHAR